MIGKKTGWMAAIAIVGSLSCDTALAEKWRLALEEREGSVQDTYAQEFKKRIAERSDGDITVEVYPYGSLGTSPQLTRLVQQNIIQFAFASPGHLASVIPEAGVFTLHFLLSDDNAVNAQVLADTETRPILQEAYQAQKLRLLDILPEGWMAWTADRAIETPEDMEGFRIRTMSSPIAMESYRAYGADPKAMPYADIHSALQQGRIDGQANPVFAIEEMGLHEIQDYLIQARQAQFITSLVAARDFHESLPEEQRTMIDEVTGQLRGFLFDNQEEFNEQRLETIEEDSDIERITLTDEQREAFREKSLPVRETYIEQAGERGRRILETLDKELRAAEKSKGGPGED